MMPLKSCHCSSNCRGVFILNVIEKITSEESWLLFLDRIPESLFKYWHKTALNFAFSRLFWTWAGIKHFKHRGSTLLTINVSSKEWKCNRQVLQKSALQVSTTLERTASLGDLRHLSCLWMVPLGETRLSDFRGLSTVRKSSVTREPLTQTADQLWASGKMS